MPANAPEVGLSCYRTGRGPGSPRGLPPRAMVVATGCWSQSGNEGKVGERKTKLTPATGAFTRLARRAH
jgi:hypothetical protein